MRGRLILYGATGYTGRRIAEALAGVGVDLVLAGRDAAALRAVAAPLGRPWAAVDLGDREGLDRMLEGAAAVLHAAGPFAQTAAPMLAACLRAGAHYLDLGGEWPVFAAMMARDAEARAAGIMMAPGVGLTIAATDCLLALAKQRQPDAVKLRLGISKAQVISRGSVATAATLLGPGAVIRQGGALVSVPAGSLARAFDFGAGLREATAMSWADVVTGEFSTGVLDIEVYSELGPGQRLSNRAAGLAMSVTGPGPWRAAGRALAAAWPQAPGGDAPSDAQFVMVAEAVDPWRRVQRLRMRTRDGYSVSVATAAAAALRVLAGEAEPGFQTPS
ncbi:MAG TPA: saccharopine dehydrogenase NADP-binding domain-containing protein, partial [Phenylobacterium sp.]|nr:saccharopine dehydrogenase NADP-binding domain-containing protein [Phenylobacterium sp.]